MYKYYLSAFIGSEKVEREVTLEEYCLAERKAGFYPKLSSDHRDYLTTPATASFGNGHISGRSVYIGKQ